MAATVAPRPREETAEAAPSGPTFDKSKITNEESAAEQLVSAGLFAKDEPGSDETPAQDEEIQPGETRGDDAEGETPPSDQVDASPSEPEEIPAIEAPVSWAADEKAAFAKLTPEIQQTVLRRESERERSVSTRLQEAAQTKTQLEAQLQQAANERAQQSQYIRGVLLQLTPELNKFQSVDWDKMAVENPAEWARQRQTYDSVIGRMNTASGQLQLLDQQQQAANMQRLQVYRNEEWGKLQTKIPDYADPVKAAAINKELVQYLTKADIGYTEQEVLGKYDHRDVVVARKAMLYDKMIAAREAANTKRVPTGNVRQLRPGVPAPGGAKEEATTARQRASRDALRKTGSTADAANLLMDLGIVS